MRVLWLAVLFGCTMPTAPRFRDSEPRNAVEVDRRSYQSVYEAVAECAGLPSRWDVGTLHIYLVPGGQTFDCPPNTFQCAGLWVPVSKTYRRIYTAGEPSPGNLFRHEALHDILNDPTHRSPAFGRCDA